jgi:hypothetical protein
VKLVATSLFFRICRAYPIVKGYSSVIGSASQRIENATNYTKPPILRGIRGIRGFLFKILELRISCLSEQKLL